jgi:excisionase family DNA binding protein
MYKNDFGEGDWRFQQAGFVRLAAILAPRGPIPRRQVHLVGWGEVRPLSAAREARTAYHRMACRRHPRTDRPPGRLAVPKSPTLPKFYTIQEISDSLDVSPRTVRRWIGSRELIAHGLGRLVRVADDELRTFLARRRGF